MHVTDVSETNLITYVVPRLVMKRLSVRLHAVRPSPGAVCVTVNILSYLIVTESTRQSAVMDLYSSVNSDDTPTRRPCHGHGHVLAHSRP